MYLSKILGATHYSHITHLWQEQKSRYKVLQKTLLQNQRSLNIYVHIIYYRTNDPLIFTCTSFFWLNLFAKETVQGKWAATVEYQELSRRFRYDTHIHCRRCKFILQ